MGGYYYVAFVYAQSRQREPGECMVVSFAAAAGESASVAT